MYRLSMQGLHIRGFFTAYRKRLLVGLHHSAEHVRIIPPFNNHDRPQLGRMCLTLYAVNTHDFLAFRAKEKPSLINSL